MDKKIHKVTISTLLLAVISSGTMASQKSIEELFDNSMLAAASYVLFEGGEGSEQKLIGGLEHDTSIDWKDSHNNKKRNLFIEKFSLLHHEENTDTSNFSATVFRRKSDNQNIFVSRGTETGEVWGDVVVADIAGIMFSGTPQSQLIDLHNYVQRLKTPKGTKYSIIEHSTFSAFYLTFGEKQDGFDHMDWFDKRSIDGVGHSLGGNLTSGFGRMFKGSVQDSYTYNSAGTAGPLAFFFGAIPALSLFTKPLLSEGEFYNAIGGEVNYNNYLQSSNVYGEDGIELTTSDVLFNQIGDRIKVNIELGDIPLLADLKAHSSLALMDSLGVAWNFNHIDPSYTLANHSAFMDAAGIDESQDLENLTGDLHELISGNEEKNLWNGIYNISKKAKNSGVITSLVDLSPAEILTIYNQSDAIKERVIYSAFKGIPFVYDGASSYTSFDDPDDFSPKAIFDLSGMLAVELKNNVEGDNSASDIASIGNVVFTKPNGTAVTNSVATDTNQTYVVFDKLGGNTLLGTAEIDRLYGLAGNDILDGFAGDDHLEGGDNDDTLLGGKEIRYSYKV